MTPLIALERFIITRLLNLAAQTHQCRNLLWLPWRRVPVSLL